MLCLVPVEITVINGCDDKMSYASRIHFNSARILCWSIWRKLVISKTVHESRQKLCWSETDPKLHYFHVDQLFDFLCKLTSMQPTSFSQSVSPYLQSIFIRMWQKHSNVTTCFIQGFLYIFYGDKMYFSLLFLNHLP